jgi:hypothetical protein
MLAATRTARASAKLLRPRTRNFCKKPAEAEAAAAEPAAAKAAVPPAPAPAAPVAAPVTPAPPAVAPEGGGGPGFGSIIFIGVCGAAGYGYQNPDQIPDQVVEYMPEQVKEFYKIPVKSTPAAPVATPKAAAPPQAAAPAKAAAPPQAAPAPSKPTLADLQLRLETLRNLEKQIGLTKEVIADVKLEKSRLKESIRAV